MDSPSNLLLLLNNCTDVLKMHNPEQTLLSLGFAVVDLLNSGVIAGENGGLTLVEDRVLSPQRGVEPRLLHEQNKKDSFALFKDKCQDSAPQNEGGFTARNSCIKIYAAQTFGKRISSTRLLMPRFFMLAICTSSNSGKQSIAQSSSLAHRGRHPRDGSSPTQPC